MTVDESLLLAWHSLLDKWSGHAVAALRLRQSHTSRESEVLLRGTLKLPSETVMSVRALEERMGRKLPSSYKHFLLASGGFLHSGIDGLFYGSGTVGLFQDVHPEQREILSQGEAEYECDPSMTFAPRAVAGKLTKQAIWSSIAVSDVAAGQFFCLLHSGEDVGRSPTAFAFDFWDVPRLYASFFDLMSDEAERSMQAMQGS